MKKLFVCITLFILFISSCSLMRNSNSSDISISLSLNSRSFQIQDIEKVNLTVTGSGMRTINRETTSNTVYVKVEYGLNRTFQIDIRLANGDEYTGSTTVNVNSSTKSVPISLRIDESGFDFDIIIPNNQIAVDKSGKDIAIEGDVLYLGVWEYGDENDSGAYLYDITNRAEPSYISNASLWADGLSVDVSGDYLYVANGGSNLRVFNVADKLVPNLLTTTTATIEYASNSSTLKTVVDSSNAYVLSYATNPDGSGSNFFKFDFTDVGNPVKSINYSVGEANPKSFCIDDKYAYVVGRSLDIYDIVIDQDIRFYNDSLYLLAGETAYDVVKRGDNLFIVCSSELLVMNVANPSAPVEIASYTLVGEAIDDGCPSSGKALSIYGNYLYIADGNAGIVILDISNPLEPVLKDSIDTVGEEYFRDVYYYDSNLYAVVETFAERNNNSYIYSYTLE